MSLCISCQCTISICISETVRTELKLAGEAVQSLNYYLITVHLVNFIEIRLADSGRGGGEPRNAGRTDIRGERSPTHRVRVRLPRPENLYDLAVHLRLPLQTECAQEPLARAPPDAPKDWREAGGQGGRTARAGGGCGRLGGTGVTVQAQ